MSLFARDLFENKELKNGGWHGYAAPCVTKLWKHFFKTLDKTAFLMFYLYLLGIYSIIMT